MGERLDLLHRLVIEHRTQHRTLRRFAATEIPCAQGPAIASATIDLAAHLATTHALVHPLARAVLLDGRTPVSHRRLEARTVLHYLRQAGRCIDEDVRFRDVARRAADTFATYSEREELELFPYARHAVDAGELARLGELLPLLRQQALAAYARRTSVDPVSPWEDESLLTRMELVVARALEEQGPPRLAPHLQPRAQKVTRARASRRG